MNNYMMQLQSPIITNGADFHKSGPRVQWSTIPSKFSSRHHNWWIFVKCFFPNVPNNQER